MNKSALLPFICVAVLSACGSRDQSSSSAALADTVEVVILKKELAAKQLSLPAELLPWEKAELFAKVDGYVKEIRVNMGDRVRRNDILAILDAPEVAAIHAKALADLQASQASYQASLDNYRRMRKASQEQGAISESELDRSRNQMLADSAFYEAAKSSAGANAQLKNYLMIRAPFDGVITRRLVDPGTLVGKIQQPMIVVEDLSRLRLRVAIPERYTAAQPESTTIRFTVDAQPSKDYPATLARTSNLIDSKTRTELWEFEVSNSRGDLKSGMMATAAISLKRNEPTFVIPYSALVTTLERNFVIRVSAGKAEWVDVRNGITTKDKVEIFGSLEDGDQLIRKANDEIKPGAEVKFTKVKS